MLLGVLPAALAAQQPDTGYRPISLTDAIRLAKDNNVSAVTAGNSVRSANLSIRSARAQLYPTFSASAGQSKQAGDRLGQSGQLVPYTSAWTYNTGLTANLTVFDGGKAFADVRKSKADVASAQANETNTDANLSLQVKTQYNAILAAKEAEAAARAQLEVAQQQLEMSIAKVNAGAANVSDSLKGVVGVGNAELAILNAQQSVRAASAALTHLVGTPYFVTANPSDTVAIPPLTVDSATLVQMAIDGPSVRAASASLTAASASIRSARSAYLPSVSASANYTGNGTSAAYGLNNNPYPYSRSLSLRLNYPIFNGYSRENQIATAQIAAENAEAQIKDTKLQAQQTIITQIGALKNAEEKMRVQQISVRASEEDLRVSQQRYSLGAGTLLDVLTSQQNLIVARQSLIQARLDYRNARAQIEQAVGRDLP